MKHAILATVLVVSLAASGQERVETPRRFTPIANELEQSVSILLKTIQVHNLILKDQAEKAIKQEQRISALEARVKELEQREHVRGSAVKP